jgi:hypothetical protein
MDFELTKKSESVFINKIKYPHPTLRNEPYFALDLLAQTFSSTSQMKL